MKRTLIIAEAGVNHNGSIELAKKLIEVAAEAGADYVKFQTFKAEKVISRSAKKAAYQIENTGKEAESQLDMVKKLELNKHDHKVLIEHCRKTGIKFLSTAFDHESIDLLDKLGVDFYKIPSGEITNLPYLKKVASKGKPIVLSTGMAWLGEVETALAILLNGGIQRKDITILHCTTEYPTPMEDVNLKAMNTLAEAFKVQVGYSDHTLGVEVPIAAVARGAVCIEKHFTLDKNMKGPDHKASLEPGELKDMIKGIRNIEKAFGSGLKQPSVSEKKNIHFARKSIHVSRDLCAGYVLQGSDFIMLRPGTGISPMEIGSLIGKKLKSNVREGERLSYECVIF